MEAALPRDLKEYKVFIASPGNLQPERTEFRDVIEEYNKHEARPRGVEFVAVGWEDTFPGVGRPQTIINAEIQTCHYFLLLFWNRWGTRPVAAKDAAFTSGSEEEYHVALQCYQDPEHPLRDIAVFFKGVDAAQLNDPGPQLQKVLRFRKRLEKERRLKFHAFDAKEEFASALRGLLGKWRRDHEDGCVVRRGSQIGGASLRPIPSEAGELGSPTEAPDGPNRALIDHAWSLANEGKLTNAETLFAKAISRGDDPEAFRSYGAFLLRLGRRALAGVMFERIVELAGEPPGLWHAIAYGNLGLLRELSGDLVQAEQYQRKSLQIHEQRGARDRITTVHLNLGIIAKRRGQFSVAEAEFREAAALALEIGREETVSQAYNNLGFCIGSQEILTVLGKCTAKRWQSQTDSNCTSKSPRHARTLELLVPRSAT